MNAATEREYNDAANTTRDRIVALIPDHPEILTMDDPYDLIVIQEFQCDDIGPSFAQVACALASAKAKHAQDAETRAEADALDTEEKRDVLRDQRRGT